MCIGFIWGEYWERRAQHKRKLKLKGLKAFSSRSTIHSAGGRATQASPAVPSPAREWRVWPFSSLEAWGQAEMLR